MGPLAHRWRGGRRCHRAVDGNLRLGRGGHIEVHGRRGGGFTAWRVADRKVGRGGVGRGSGPPVGVVHVGVVGVGVGDVGVVGVGVGDVGVGVGDVDLYEVGSNGEHVAGVGGEPRDHPADR